MLRHLIRFGIFAAITVGITAWIGLQILDRDTGAHYELTASFDDVTGLFVGDDVKLAGVAIGSVTSIEAVDGEAVIRFSVKEAVRVPVDSSVSVKWRNLIGQRYVYLHPGDSSEMLRDGQPVERTQGVVDLGRLVNSLGPLADAIEPEQLNAIFNALAEGFGGQQDDIESILDDFDAVLSVLSEREETLQQLLGDYDTITGALASRDAQIQTMIDNLVLLSQSFADNTELVDDALVHLAAFSGDLDRLLSENGDELASVLGDLAVVTDTIVAKLPELEATFQDLPTTLTALYSTVSHGRHIRINAVCLHTEQPPCPHPIVLGEQEGQSGSEATRFTPTAAEVLPAAGPGALTSPEAWAALAIGGLR